MTYSSWIELRRRTPGLGRVCTRRNVRGACWISVQKAPQALPHGTRIENSDPSRNLDRKSLKIQAIFSPSSPVTALPESTRI